MSVSHNQLKPIKLKKTRSNPIFFPYLSEWIDELINEQSFVHIPCSTVLVWGGSWGSCLTLRADEDAAAPPCRRPLTQTDVTVKQTERTDTENQCEGDWKQNWWREEKVKWPRTCSTAPVNLFTKRDLQCVRGKK